MVAGKGAAVEALATEAESEAAGPETEAEAEGAVATAELAEAVVFLGVKVVVMVAPVACLVDLVAQLDRQYHHLHSHTVCRNTRIVVVRHIFPGPSSEVLVGGMCKL